MNTRKRAEEFTRMVGLELKGAITARGFNATQVAKATSRSPAAFNRWLNGKVEIPLTVLCESCEHIDVDPHFIVETAYSRMAGLLGERHDGAIDPEVAAYAQSDEPGITAKTLPPYRTPISGRVSDLGYTLAADDTDYEAENEAMMEEP